MTFLGNFAGSAGVADTTQHFAAKDWTSAFCASLSGLVCVRRVATNRTPLRWRSNGVFFAVTRKKKIQKVKKKKKKNRTPAVFGTVRAI